MKAVLWVLYWVLVVAGVLSVVGAFFGVIASLEGQSFWFGFFGSLIILGAFGILFSSLFLAAWGSTSSSISFTSGLTTCDSN